LKFANSIFDLPVFHIVKWKYLTQKKNRIYHYAALLELMKSQKLYPVHWFQQAREDVGDDSFAQKNFKILCITMV